MYWGWVGGVLKAVKIVLDVHRLLVMAEKELADMSCIYEQWCNASEQCTVKRQMFANINVRAFRFKKCSLRFNFALSRSTQNI